ncbi:ATP-grasp domain-containing protein (plasmid) [Priestia sp. MF3]|uniref:ATP-grasp domain-containing protein n=1 Tax=Priestia TaxID=2800373 RepID=UPI002D807C31|nr:ATP-grasp domain-containing protein [Priestia megaterium]MEB4887681.1 ATP-grasp domain-containing protein [Priestia megaterium]
MGNKHILFIDMNETSHGLKALKKAKELNYSITFFTSGLEFYKESTIMEALPCINQLVKIDTHNNLDILVNEAKKINNIKKIDGVYASSDTEILAAAKVCDALGLRGNSYDAVLKCRNKYVMRKEISNTNLKQPEFIIISSLEEVEEAVEHFISKGKKFPLIFKPVDSTASDGVKLVHSIEDIIESVKQHYNSLHITRGFYKSRDIVLEEYINGNLYSAEVILTPNKIEFLGFTDRKLTPPPKFVELDGSYPYEFKEELNIKSYILNVIQSLGLTFGACHIEFLMNEDNQPVLVEVNPRLAGFTISSIISRCRNVDIIEQLVRLHVDEEYNFGQNNVGTGYFKVISPSKAGIYKGYKGNLDPNENLIDFKISMPVNSYLTNKPGSNRDLLGVVTTFGNNKSEAVENCENVLRNVKIIVNS